MWTAFVWGFGCSCGAAFGLLLFIVLFWLLEWLTGKAEQKAKAIGFNELSLQALTTRNELSEKMVNHLGRIVAARESKEPR